MGPNIQQRWQLLPLLKGVQFVLLDRGEDDVWGAGKGAAWSVTRRSHGLLGRQHDGKRVQRPGRQK